MIEQIVERSGKKVIQVRSDGGKLLFVKTKEGYEIKCPRTKQVCVIKYQEMLMDCLKCLDEASGGDPSSLFDQLKRRAMR